MTVFKMLLKVLIFFRLLSTDEIQTLTADINHWEENAKTNKENKLNALYLKIHDGVLARLLLPFAYFFIVRYLNDMVNPEQDYLDDDE